MSTAHSSKRQLAIPNVVLVAIPLLAIAGGVLAFLYFPKEKEKFEWPTSVLRKVVRATQLDKEFVDANNDMVADRPARTLDLKKLVFYVLENDKAPWEDFRVHLEKRVKMPVDVLFFDSREQLIKQFKEGKIQVAAISTGMVPTMVNAAGFVPAFCMANDKGEYGYKVNIVASANSSIYTLQDLRGETIALTGTGSLSSFKAPLQILDEAGLRVGNDYDVVFSPGQRSSIDGLVENRYKAIAVASDLFQRTVKTKNIPEAKFRVIYESRVSYPPASFGMHHALKKELADEIHKAFLDYTWGPAFQKEFGPAGYKKFVPISYKTDWASVRKIDEKINQFVEGK